MKSCIFENRKQFRDWLFLNHETSLGIFLVLSKSSKMKTLTALEALEEALCFGWIDGKIKKQDEDTYLKYFSKRIKKSTWSKRNREIAANLIANHHMHESGLKTIFDAKANGHWFNKDDDIIISVEDFTKLLKPYPLALNHYLKMSHSIQKTYATHYFIAKKDETKQKRLFEIIDRLNQNKKPME